MGDLGCGATDRLTSRLSGRAEPAAQRRSVRRTYRASLRTAGTRWWLGGAGVGLVAGVFAGWLAGGGHGTCLPAILLFPYAMGGALALGTSDPALLAVALIQYPVYGALIGAADDRRGRTAVLRMLISLHLLGVVVTVVFARTTANCWP